jgi:hypothetical protein
MISGATVTLGNFEKRLYFNHPNLIYYEEGFIFYCAGNNVIGMFKDGDANC